MASWNSRRKSAVSDIICIIIGIVVALWLMSVLFRDAGATTEAAPAETLTMSATWWVATPTPPVPSVTFAPTATPPTEPTPTPTPIVANPIILAHVVYLPNIWRD